MIIELQNFSDIDKFGIYLITNLSNNKKYVGSTKNSFKDRWYTHIQKLRKGTHPNIHLQKAFNLYKEECFKFSILEILSDPKDLYKKEALYIRELNVSDREIGYNIEIDPENKEVSEETRLKISNTLKKGFESGRIKKNDTCLVAGWNKGKKCPQIGETRREMFGSISVFDANRNLIVTFRSVTDLTEWSENNILPGLIISNCNKKGGILRKDKIYLSIRQDSKYKGLYFKKNNWSLSPEMGIAKWENCGKGEIPNPQLSQELTNLEGSETNS
jgi:group I intron endonuclease